MTQVLELPAHSALSYPVEHSRRPALAHHRVILISAHPLFLVGLRLELDQTREFKVIGVVQTAQEALEQVRQEPVSLILIDQTRPGAAVPAINYLQAKLEGRIPLIVLGSGENPAQVDQLKSLGVTAFVSKCLDGEHLRTALNEVMQDRPPLPLPGIRFKSDNSALKEKATVKVKSPLSPREQQILEEIAKGHSNKEVAQILCISNHTLKNHLNNIFKKLDVEDRTQALMLGVRNGWIRL